MKTIDLAKTSLTIDQLLDAARDESVMVKAADGATFVLSSGDDLTTEIELLRRNHRFLALLDACKQDQRTLSLDEAERRLQ